MVVEEVISRQCINILHISSTVPQCDVFSLTIVDSSATLALKKSSAVLNKSAQYAALFSHIRQTFLQKKACLFFPSLVLLIVWRQWSRIDSTLLAHSSLLFDHTDVNFSNISIDNKLIIVFFIMRFI